MVSQYRELALLHHQIQALARIGAISHDIPQTHNAFDALELDIGNYSRQGFQVAVNVTDECLSHGALRYTLAGRLPCKRLS
jgi:hypothetical protein